MKPISRNEVRRVGEFLRQDDRSDIERTKQAFDTLSAWRNAHAIHLNNFNSWIRKKVRRRYDNVIIAQRLKRFESIEAKLKANPKMQLHRMQDIAGMRAVLTCIKDTYNLFNRTKSSTGDRNIVHIKDYIQDPKPDGYRSIHLIFKCRSHANPHADDLAVEFQIRTHLQHIWSTAYETLGTVQHTVFKRGEGEEFYKAYFRMVSALFSIAEGQPLLEACRGISKEELIEELRFFEDEYRILQILRGAALIADTIEKYPQGKDAYHVVELDSLALTAKIYAFTEKERKDAEEYYAKREFETRDEPNISVVQVAVGDVKALRRAYPNYFLDTQTFIYIMEKRLGIKQIDDESNHSIL